MLDKRLQLGGLQVGGPRTMQTPVRFKKADNVYQTTDGYLVPRFHCASDIAIDASENVEVHSLANYGGEVFSIVRDLTNNYMRFFIGGTKVPMYSTGYSNAQDFSTPGECESLGPQCVEKLGCLFINFPYYGLYKYDGVQAYRAGVPLPFFSSAQRADAGAAYIRVIQHHIDFQGNIVNSGYVEFRATPAANIVNIRHDFSATDIIPNTGVSPIIRTSKFDNYYDEHYWVATGAGTVNAGPRTVTIPTGGNHNVAVDAYVIVSATLTTTAVTGFSINTKGIAMKVVTSTATTVTLSLDSCRILDASNNWVLEGMSVATTLFSAARNGTNYWCSVWASNTATGNYVFKDLFGVLYHSTTSQTEAVDCTSLVVASSGSDQTAFNLAGNLGDIYDVTTVKDVFTHALQFGNPQDYPISFTTYGDMAVISDNNSNIRFSDTSLGGAFEMINGLSFVVVGEDTDGKVQAVCGNSDFLLVSRQRKNYYLAGNLPTANYRVQPITGASAGCYSNESCISFEDKVIFYTCKGIYALYSGARCSEISENIKGFFQNFSNTKVWSEDSAFDISDFPSFKEIFTVPDQYVRVRSDTLRGLVIFLISFEGSGMSLVLNMNNGEFYTWTGFNGNIVGAGGESCTVKDILFIDGEYYVTMNYINESDLSVAQVYKEEKTTNRYQYEFVFPIVLETAWFTAGEPSLEKQFSAMKLWGVVVGSVAISYMADWTDTQVECPTYTSTETPFKLSHFTRLSPSKLQAISVRLQPTVGDGSFEIEGMELEFNLLQQRTTR
jgi:hypothetical protein